MNKVRINNRTTLAAESWNDFNLSQALDATKILFNKTAKLDITHWKFSMLYVVLNIKYKLLFILELRKTPKTYIISALFPLTKFIVESNTLTEFKLKHFRVWFHKYYAPADGLANITIEEFRFLDPMYVNYKKTGETHWLDGIVGILYRKKREDYNPTSVDYKGDIREDFNEHQIIRNSKIASKLSLEKRQLIFLTYEGCRNEIIASCSNLFNSEESQEKGRNSGYGGLITELAGNKFGDYNQTCKTNLITAFNYLEDQAIKLKKQKK